MPEGWREVAWRTRPDPQAHSFSEEIKQEEEPVAFAVFASLSLFRVLEDTGWFRVYVRF